MTNLAQELEKKRKQIRTDSYSMSIGEWISIYKEGELDVHPEFQRYFRWRPIQKTRLIESILLGIPIPPIFVSQRKDGKWDVIDGVQRLSTIFQFVGILKDEDGTLVEPLKLMSSDYLPLEGMYWGDEAEAEPEDPLSFNQLQRLLIKRAKIDVSIILKESDESSKYELFQRLNTGGSHLSDQEIRNAIMVMMNKEDFLWFRDLCSFNPFLETLSLTDRALEERYEMDMAMRFILFRNIEEGLLNNIKDINDFITKQMIALIESGRFRSDEEHSTFRATFQLLADKGGQELMHRYDPAKGRFLGGFLVSAFEAVAIGIGHNIGKGLDLTDIDIKERAAGLWSDAEFTAHSGSGVRASQRVPYSIPIGRRIFVP